MLYFLTRLGTCHFCYHHPKAVYCMMLYNQFWYILKEVSHSYVVVEMCCQRSQCKTKPLFLDQQRHLLSRNSISPQEGEMLYDPCKQAPKGACESEERSRAVLVKEGMTEIFEMELGAMWKKNPSKLYLLKKLWSHRMYNF